MHFERELANSSLMPTFNKGFDRPAGHEEAGARGFRSTCSGLLLPLIRLGPVTALVLLAVPLAAALYSRSRAQSRTAPAFSGVPPLARGGGSGWRMAAGRLAGNAHAWL